MLEPLSKNIANSVVGLKYDQLPKSVIELAKMCLLDMIGSAIAGSAQEPARIVGEWAAAAGGKPESPVFCSGERLPANMAALVNGTMAHIVELDDVNMRCFGHPGVAVIPAVLAVAYREKVPGAAVIAAIIAGYETMGRLGTYLTASHYQLWHATATLGSFGAAAGAAKVLNLSPDKVVNALGIAGSFSAGLREVFVGGTYCKHLHAGKAAQSGVIAAELAAGGFTGPVGIFDGDMGMGKAMTATVDSRKLEKDKREPFEIEYTEIKPYASCRSAHAAVDCMLRLRPRVFPHWEEIKTIRIGTTRAIVDDPAWGSFRPRNPLEAKLSIPYNAAVALLDGEVTLSQFSPARIASPDIQNTLNKISLYFCQDIDTHYPETIGAEIGIELSNGEAFSRRKLFPKGHPQNPLQTGDIIKKFTGLAMLYLPPATAELIADNILNMEKAADIRKILEKLNEKLKGNG